MTAARVSRSVAARSSCTVGRLDAVYRLPAPRLGARERLDRALATALDDVLEAAIERAGVPLSDEICVRVVHIVARLRLEVPDSELALAWSLAAAAAIEREIREGGANVVRYGSRQHALVDLAISAGRGDVTRAWAWRQMGIWQESDGGSRVSLIEGALETLARDARGAAAVLADVARRGGLRPLVALGRVESWMELERAALASASVDVRDLDLLGADDATSAGTAHRAESADYDPSSDHSLAATLPLGVLPVAERIVRESFIVAAARDYGSLPAETSRALATLAMLETSPDVVMMGGARVAATLAAVRAAIVSQSLTASDDATAPTVGEANTSRASEMSRESRARRDAQGAPNARGAQVTRDTRANIGDASEAKGRAASSADAATDDALVPLVREGAVTRVGGLLFLLHIVRDNELPARIVADPVLGARSLAWTLHRLGIALAHVDETDPAVLAFCGRGPLDNPPGHDEPPPSTGEIAVIDELRDVVIASLRERLGTSDEWQSDDKLSTTVIRRRADIAADPAWIEVRFALEEVSVQIRRAGLDLDLDWLPWLGVVMRFVYG